MDEHIHLIEPCMKCGRDIDVDAEDWSDGGGSLDYICSDCKSPSDTERMRGITTSKHDREK